MANHFHMLQTWAVHADRVMRVHMFACGIRAWSPIWRREIALTDLSHMAGRQRTSSGSQGARDGSICASRRNPAIAPLHAWQGQRVSDPDRSLRSLQLQPQPWRGHCRLRAMVVASRRGGQPSKVRGSTLTHPQPIPHPYPRPCRRFCRVCRVPTDPSRAPCSGALSGDPGGGITRLLRRVGDYEDDPGGYQHLGLELRAYVCGARVGRRTFLSAARVV